MKTKKIAFTLIELIVVVAIIGGLALLLLPLLNKSRDRAQMVKCVNNLRQLSIAALLYASDHDGVIPDIDDPNNPDNSLINSDYVGNDDIYLCPRDDRDGASTSYTAYQGTPASLFSKVC